MGILVNAEFSTIRFFRYAAAERIMQIVQVSCMIVKWKPRVSGNSRSMRISPTFVWTQRATISLSRSPLHLFLLHHESEDIELRSGVK